MAKTTVKQKKELTPVDLYYVYGNAGEKPVEQIAKDLGCEVEDIAKHVEIAIRRSEREVPPQQRKTKTQPLSRELFARKRERGFVGMTQAASEAGDEFRDKHGNSVGVKGNEDHIHRPFGDDEPIH